MTVHHNYRPALTSHPKLPRSSQIFAFAGGYGNGGLKWACHNPPAAVFSLDVQTELKKYVPILQMIPDHRAIPMLEYATANSLLHATYPDHPALKQVGNCSAQLGMGQRGGYGALGIAPQISDEKGAELVDWAMSKLIQDSEGMLSLMRAFIFTGLAGGTGSISQVLIARLFKDLGTRSGVPMEINFHVTDSVTFAGVGEKIHTNAAASLKALIDFSEETNHFPGSKTVVNVRVASLPPVGIDSQLRQQFDLEDKQAWFSAEFQHAWGMIGPNHALSHQYGNIFHTSTEYFRAIPQEMIAAHIAAGYHQDIEGALQRVQPAPHLINEFETGPQATPLVRPAIDGLIQRIHQFDEQAFLVGVQAPGATLNYTITAIDIEGRLFDCEHLTDHFANSPKSLNEAITDLVVIETIRDLLTVEESESDLSIAELDLDIEKVTKKCRKLFSAATTLRFGRKAAQRKLHEASQALRDKTDQRRELLTLQEELQKCLRITTGLRDRKHSQLSDTLKVLDQFRAKGKVTEDSGGFYYETVDKAFPHLLKLTTTDRDLQQFILTSQASAATDAGIKAILGATSSDVHALAEKCLGPAPIPGAWPAAIKRNPQHTFLVLPPMPRALGEALRKSVRERASTWHVVFADSCSLGINAVRINVFFPRTAQELIPGFLWSELQKLSQSELKVLHVLDGQASKDSDLNAEEGAK